MHGWLQMLRSSMTQFAMEMAPPPFPNKPTPFGVPFRFAKPLSDTLSDSLW